MAAAFPPTPHIVFAGGGTGGHLFPGLAVAEELLALAPSVTITFAGSGKPLEQEHVAGAGFRYVTIPSRPAPRKPWHAVRFVADNLAGYWAARWLLREQHVSLVVGLGSYSSAATVRAAQSYNLPTVLLEANAVPGRATRWLAGSASLTCAAFAQVESHLKPGARLRVTGTPVRRAFIRAGQKPQPRLPMASPSSRQLTVLGGSGGSQRLNEVVPRALYKLGPALRDWQIVHQTGSGRVAETQELYQKLGLSAVVVSFIDNLPDVLRETDLVVCRGGGATLAELAVTGTPALVVPYAEASDDHQTENARRVAASGGCRMVAEEDPAARLDHRLSRALQPLVADDAERTRMAQRMRTLGRPQAAAEIAGLLRELCCPAPLRATA